MLVPIAQFPTLFDAMTRVSDKDVKRITELFQELVGLMTSLGLIDVVKPKLKPGVKKKKAPAKAKLSTSSNTDAQKVLDYYRKIHPRKARGVKPGHDDFAMIKNRLKEFTVDELKRAIDENFKCSWHRQAAGGHSLKMVFRNDGKVERFLEGKTEEGPGVGHHPGDQEHTDGPQRFKTD